MRLTFTAVLIEVNAWKFIESRIVEKNRKKSNWVAQEEEKIRNLLTF